MMLLLDDDDDDEYLLLVEGEVVEGPTRWRRFRSQRPAVESLFCES